MISKAYQEKYKITDAEVAQFNVEVLQRKVMAKAMQGVLRVLITCASGTTINWKYVYAPNRPAKEDIVFETSSRKSSFFVDN